MKKYNIKEIISYVDRSKFNGSGYKSIGFKFISKTIPGYNYYKGNIKLSRNSAQKHKLKDLLGNGFDPNLTETENMIKNNYLKVYDCGNFKVIYKNNSIERE